MYKKRTIFVPLNCCQIITEDVRSQQKHYAQVHCSINRAQCQSLTLLSVLHRMEGQKTGCKLRQPDKTKLYLTKCKDFTPASLSTLSTVGKQLIKIFVWKVLPYGS